MLTETLKTRPGGAGSGSPYPMGAASSTGWPHEDKDTARPGHPRAAAAQSALVASVCFNPYWGGRAGHPPSPPTRDQGSPGLQTDTRRGPKTGSVRLAWRVTCGSLDDDLTHLGGCLVSGWAGTLPG